MRARRILSGASGEPSPRARERRAIPGEAPASPCKPSKRHRWVPRVRRRSRRQPQPGRRVRRRPARDRPAGRDVSARPTTISRRPHAVLPKGAADSPAPPGILAEHGENAPASSAIPRRAPRISRRVFGVSREPRVADRRIPLDEVTSTSWGVYEYRGNSSGCSAPTAPPDPPPSRRVLSPSPRARVSRWDDPGITRIGPSSW
jgi:hypothetical protein